MSALKKTHLFFTIIFIIVFACNNENNTQQSNNDTILEIIDNESNTGVKNIITDTTKKQEAVGQSLKLASETLVFSFKTKKGKTMNLVMGKDEKYLAYRFGTKDKVELQFPETLENTFEQFTYSYYFRGGGAMNAGVDLNHLSFKGDTHKFVIYNQWTAGEDEDDEGTTSVGIKIIDLSTQKEVIIEGIPSSIQGGLVDFRFNGLVKVDEEGI
jgi:hypothetical protein